MAQFGEPEAAIGDISGAPHLSIIIPAFNEARRLPLTLKRLHDYLIRQDYAWEIIVVSNGSTDETESVVHEALDWLQKAVQQSGEPDPTLYDHLGDIYARLKAFDKARDAWRRSIELEPNDQVKKKLEITPAGTGPAE